MPLEAYGPDAPTFDDLPPIADLPILPPDDRPHDAHKLRKPRPRELPATHLGRTPPWSSEAERAVLASVLIEPIRLTAIVEHLRPADFYEERHQLLFQTMLEETDRGRPVDVVSVVTALQRMGRLDRVGGIDYLGALSESLATTASLENYAKTVESLALVRRVMFAAATTLEDGYASELDPATFVESAEKRMWDAMSGRDTTGAEPLRDLLAQTFEEILSLRGHKGEATGITTGFAEIDRMMLGVHPGDLVIVAARPSMGKTTFAMNLALNAAQHGYPVAVFSLEMTKKQLVQRLLSSHSRVDLKDMRSGDVDEAKAESLQAASAELSELAVQIDDTPAISTLELRAKCRRLASEGKCKMIVVDYLQLMRAPSAKEGGRKVDSREQEISEISRSLKGLAKELGVPVVALSQLNRGLEQRQDKRPILSDLRESGAIEQDADVIMFIYRDVVYNKATSDTNIAEIIVGKQRNGPTGTVRLYFNGRYTRFDNLQENGFDDDLAGA